MSWHTWVEELRRAPLEAVTDLLRGSADVTPYERVAPHEFLLAVLPRASRLVQARLIGERDDTAIPEADDGVKDRLDAGLTEWLGTQRQALLPKGRKLSPYAAQVSEALQWPLYFDLPQTRVALAADRAAWLQWTARLNLSAYRDPEFDYWQVLAGVQTDDALQFHWQSFVVEAGRTRSHRYLGLGLLAIARLPLSLEDGLRNVRLQIQALVQRYNRRKDWGTAAMQDLADNLRSVMTRNPSLPASEYRVFLRELLAPLREDRVASVLGLLGLANSGQRSHVAYAEVNYRIDPPGKTFETDVAVQAVRRAGSPAEAWTAIHRLLEAHETYVHQTGDSYYFVRNLDRCGRAFCDKFPLRAPEIQARLFQWIYMALRVEPENPRLWMLWELALRKADQLQRSQWVLWEMTRRFPDYLPCRVELARLLADSPDATDQVQANRLLLQVLRLDPENLHAHSTLAQLAIRGGDWAAAMQHAQTGLRIAPDNEACTVLLAKAYARRNDKDDLQTAIDHLHRFVRHYPGSLTAERYLAALQKRQQLAPLGGLGPPEDVDTPVPQITLSVESDPAWLAFAESVQASNMTAADAALSTDDRVLSLPFMLDQAVSRNNWQLDVLANYDLPTQQEFPLETRLWRYLRAVATEAPESERIRARRALDEWVETERRAAVENTSWSYYIEQRRSEVDTPDSSLTEGVEWLRDLVARYRPLPAPLFA